MILGLLILMALIVVVSGIGVCIHVAHKSDLERKKLDIRSQELQQLRSHTHEMEMKRLSEESSDNEIDRTLKLQEAGIKSEVVEARILPPAARTLPAGSSGYSNDPYMNFDGSRRR